MITTAACKLFPIRPIAHDHPIGATGAILILSARLISSHANAFR